MNFTVSFAEEDGLRGLKYLDTDFRYLGASVNEEILSSYIFDKMQSVKKNSPRRFSYGKKSDSEIRKEAQDLAKALIIVTDELKIPVIIYTALIQQESLFDRWTDSRPDSRDSDVGYTQMTKAGVGEVLDQLGVTILKWNTTNSGEKMPEYDADADAVEYFRTKYFDIVERFRKEFQDSAFKLTPIYYNLLGGINLGDYKWTHWDKIRPQLKEKPGVSIIFGGILLKTYMNSYFKKQSDGRFCYNNYLRNNRYAKGDKYMQSLMDTTICQYNGNDKPLSCYGRERSVRECHVIKVMKYKDIIVKYINGELDQKIAELENSMFLENEAIHILKSVFPLPESLLTNFKVDNFKDLPSSKLKVDIVGEKKRIEAELCRGHLGKPQFYFYASKGKMLEDGINLSKNVYFEKFDCSTQKIESGEELKALVGRVAYKINYDIIDNVVDRIEIIDHVAGAEAALFQGYNMMPSGKLLYDSKKENLKQVVVDIYEKSMDGEMVDVEGSHFNDCQDKDPNDSTFEYHFSLKTLITEKETQFVIKYNHKTNLVEEISRY